jgi:hypothetical protein
MNAERQSPLFKHWFEQYNGMGLKQGQLLFNSLEVKHGIPGEGSFE